MSQGGAPDQATADAQPRLGGIYQCALGQYRREFAQASDAHELERRRAQLGELLDERGVETLPKHLMAWHSDLIDVRQAMRQALDERLAQLRHQAIWGPVTQEVLDGYLQVGKDRWARQQAGLQAQRLRDHIVGTSSQVKVVAIGRHRRAPEQIEPQIG